MTVPNIAGVKRISDPAYPKKTKGYMPVDDASTGQGHFLIEDIFTAMAPEFKPNVACVVGHPYWYPEDGSVYRCIVAHTGAWNPGHFTRMSTAEALQASIANILNAIAPEYDGTTGAVAGILYMHNGVLYRCKENTSGDWDSSKFEETSVDELFVRKYVPYSSLTVTDNSYVNGNTGNVGGNSSYKRLSLPAEFKSIRINPNFTDESKGWRFLDRAGNVLSYGKFTESVGTTYTINNPNFKAGIFEFTQGNSSDAPVVEIYGTSEDINEALSRKVNITEFTTELNGVAVKIIDKYVPYSSLTSTDSSYVSGANGSVTTGASAAGYKRLTMPAEFKTIKINPNFSHSSLGWRFADKDNVTLSYGKFTETAGTTYTINNPNFKAGTFEFTQSSVSDDAIITICESSEDINDALHRKADDAELRLYVKNLVPYSDLSVTSNSYINGNNGNITDGATAAGYKRLSMPANFTQVKVNPNFSHSSLGWRIGDTDGNTISCGKFTEAEGNTYTITNTNSKARVFEFTQRDDSDYPVITLYENASQMNKSLALKENAKDDSNPLARVGESPSYISIFKKIVHIGDSLTRGQTDTTYPTSSGADIPDYSRPVIMGKMIGNVNLNLGLGGRTASPQYNTSGGTQADWYTNATTPGMTVNFTPDDFLTNPGDCYLIALGTNDVEKGGFTGDVETDIDDVDYTNNAATSVGGYAKIIQKIKELQPKAKIFCVTIPHTRNANKVVLRAEANTKIAEIVAHFDDCYLVDLFTYAEQSNDGIFATYYKNSSHNNALGYMLRSQQYIAYIDWIIKNNLAEFRNIAFIGNDYDYVP